MPKGTIIDSLRAASSFDNRSWELALEIAALPADLSWEEIRKKANEVNTFGLDREEIREISKALDVLTEAEPVAASEVPLCF